MKCITEGKAKENREGVKLMNRKDRGEQDRGGAGYIGKDRERSGTGVRTGRRVGQVVVEDKEIHNGIGRTGMAGHHEGGAE